MNEKLVLDSLKKIKFKEDYLLIHSDLYPFIGKKFKIEIFANKLIEILGKDKTLIFPTFNFSSKYSKLFWSVSKSRGTSGILSEHFRSKNSIRSINPYHSVCVYGKNKLKVPSGIMKTSFGKKTVWEWMCKNNNVGNLSIGLGISGGGTFCHYIEFISKVNYRHNVKKNFVIEIDKNQKKNITFNYFARKKMIGNKFFKNNWKRCERDLVRNKILFREITNHILLFSYCNLSDACKFLKEKIKKDKNYFL